MQDIRPQDGFWLQANRTALYVMPVLQVGLLVTFLAVAVLHVMYSWWLLLLCLCTGLPSPAPLIQVSEARHRFVQALPLVKPL